MPGSADSANYFVAVEGHGRSKRAVVTPTPNGNEVTVSSSVSGVPEGKYRIAIYYEVFYPSLVPGGEKMSTVKPLKSGTLNVVDKSGVLVANPIEWDETLDETLLDGSGGLGPGNGPGNGDF